MAKSNSVLGKLWNFVTSLAVIAAIGWGAWYGYSNWGPSSSSVSDSQQGFGFNCRHALARLAEDYACRDSDACTMTSDELSDLKKREADIEENCN